MRRHSLHRLQDDGDHHSVERAAVSRWVVQVCTYGRGHVPVRTRPGSTDMARMGTPASSRRRCNSIVKRTFASLLRPKHAHYEPLR